MAVTASACVARWNAWTPQPVPMSSARATGSRRPAGQRDRGAADAEHVVRRERAAGATRRGRRPATSACHGVDRGVRAELHAGPDLVVGRRARRLDQTQAASAPAVPARGSAAASRRRGHGAAEDQSQGEGRERRRRARVQRPDPPAGAARGPAPPARPARAAVRVDRPACRPSRSRSRSAARPGDRRWLRGGREPGGHGQTARGLRRGAPASRTSGWSGVCVARVMTAAGRRRAARRLVATNEIDRFETATAAMMITTATAAMP